MLYGTSGMLGALMGGTAGALGGGGVGFITSPVFDGDVEENVETGAMIGGSVGAVGLSVLPKPAMAWAGKNMRNFSAGYYDQDPLKNMNRLERKLGNKVTSIKRNLQSTVRGTYQMMRGGDQSLANIQNAVDSRDATKIYNKIKNPTQLEDLQLELTKNGYKSNAIDYYKNYRSTLNSQYGMAVNTTPEEALFALRRDNAKYRNQAIDFNIKDIDDELKRLNSARSDGAISQMKHADETIKLTQAKQELNRNYEKYGELDRKYRHEIAKSESHAMWSNSGFSKKRLSDAGYKWEGAYRWGDVQAHMRSVGGDQWQADINKYSNKIAKRVGLGKDMMLNDNTVVNVMRNVHVQDLKQKRGPSRPFQKIGRIASATAFDNPNAGKMQIKNYVRAKIANTNLSDVFKIRDLRDYADSDSSTKRFKNNMSRYMSMKRAGKMSPAGRELLGKLQSEYGNNEINKVMNQMEKQGGLNQRTRGRFTLSGIGRVTNSYLEGGINATSEFRPFISSNRQTKVAMRMMTSDLSDLPLSGHSGFQRNIPFIIEEEVRTYDGRSGREVGKYMTKDNPFNGTAYKSIGKPLSRGNVKQVLNSNISKRKKLKYLKRKAFQNPKSFLRYGLRRMPGMIGNAAVVGTAGYSLLSAFISGTEEGEFDLASVE